MSLTLPEALDRTVATRGDAPAVSNRERTLAYTWSELKHAALRVAGGLGAAGLTAGDTLGLLLDNRPEFHVIDLAAVFCGAVPVSIYNSSAPEQIGHILDDADVTLVIAQATYADRARRALEGRSTRLIVLEEAWEALNAATAIDAPSPVSPEDLLTIIYTSGTTGPPKGVELTHANLLEAGRAIGELNQLQDGGRVICWLPMAHIAERNASYYMAILFGLEVTTCADPRQIGAALAEVRPTWFFAVPRVWEKLRAGAQGAGEGIPAAQLRTALGLDQIVGANIGAAPSSPELIRYFHQIGVPLAEIYGQSENCACCTCNPPDAIRIGTVGPPLPGTEIRLAADGEVLTRSATTMRGYHNNPDATAATVDADGWLHTGDVGAFDEAGYLRIIDRKKELIINAAGKNMSPAGIEAAIRAQTTLIAHAVAIGDARPYNVALIVLDPDVRAGRAADDDTVTAEIARAVADANATLSRVEQIKRYRILDEAWEPGGVALTPTQKLKRRPIAAHYNALIDEIYLEVSP